MPGVSLPGTTEGFWRSANGGGNEFMDGYHLAAAGNQFDRGPSAQSEHGIHWDEQLWVMVSNDGGKNFLPSNTGFSGRFVDAIVTDRENANRVYATRSIQPPAAGSFSSVTMVALRGSRRCATCRRG
jgi:hypothetical protein